MTPRKDGAGLLPAESLAQNAPPAAVPDPVPDDDPAAAAIALFEPMVSQLDPHRDDHPADVEYIACELVGLLRTIADDEPVPGGESGLRPSELLGETSPGNADAIDSRMRPKPFENERRAEGKTISEKLCSPR